jgi:hypothetical protein
MADEDIMAFGGLKKDAEALVCIETIRRSVVECCQDRETHNRFGRIRPIETIAL